MEKHHDFFVGIDSDGCAFDTMEIKHKECFCPNFISYFDLQPVSKYAREAWDFVNLYSQTRGCNRFLALTLALDLLRARKEVVKRGALIPELKLLKGWVQAETKLGNPALEKEVKRNPSPEMENILRWSLAVNETVARIVHHVPPFPYVRDCLEKMQQKADAIVVSQTPLEALVREWNEHEIDGYIRLIAGQEMGTKTEHISYAAKGKYNPDNILMIGDAPGDYKAALENGARFYPIVPGKEEESWERLNNEALDRFFGGTYKGDYENELIASFTASLPSHPSW
ncbi:MAG: HAD family hydrolase [Spirochaetales bacterium]|nr:HAD family hydrolase [Spirochaetales bacterium]